MKNTFFGLLIFGSMICGSVQAQQTSELMQADSFIEIQEYENALGLLHHFITLEPSRFELSKAYFLLSKSYLGTGDLNKATYQNQQSLSILRSLHYEFIADNYMQFGLIEMKKEDNDKALSYFMKARDLPYETVEFSGLLYAYIAQVYYRKGNIEKMLEFYRIAMETLRTAFEEASSLDLNHYIIRRNRLYYDRFFIGYL